MKTDVELLQEYLGSKSESAFTELVQRHFGLVYSVASRRLRGDAHLAEDVAQSVFNDLARKAHSLRNRATLGGWLYLSANTASAAVIRREGRRLARETTAHDMQTTLSRENDQPNWTQLRPVIDDAIIALREGDREAVVLRFFEQRSFADIGATLCVTEEGARKRVHRALEKLRETLQQRGVTSTGAALGVALAALGTVSSPTALSAKVAANALASHGLSAGAGAAGIVFSAALPAAVLIIGGWLVFTQRQANQELRAELAHFHPGTASIAALRAENQERPRPIAQAEVVRPPSSTGNSRPESHHNGMPASAAGRPISADIGVTESGALTFGGKPVTLKEFIDLLRYVQTTADPEARVIVRGARAPSSAMTWVVEEARRAGVRHLTVESDAKPDATFATWWF
jgi:RNA polymerase sigma factor (sigma-70 family)